MANNLNSFCDTRTLCSTYYTRELSHLTSGEVLALEPVAAQNTYHGKAEECGEKGRFSLTKPKFRKNTGTLHLQVVRHRGHRLLKRGEILRIQKHVFLQVFRRHIV